MNPERRRASDFCFAINATFRFVPRPTPAVRNFAPTFRETLKQNSNPFGCCLHRLPASEYNLRPVSPLIRPVALFISLALVSAAAAAVDVKAGKDRVTVEIGGKLFTDYCFTGANNVYYWPVIGPGGVKMTREWPMADVPGEEHDHPHHRSMWFAHGLVNGMDFWSEPATFAKRPPKVPLGKIEHEAVLETKSGAEGILKTSQKWTAPDGAVVLRSVQTLRVHDAPPTERLFDFEIALTAGDKDAVFGDTKEGTFAMRIAESMRLRRGAKGAPPSGEGHILNSEGLKDTKVWGARAKWVDMSGPIDGKAYGIAIFDHPSNLRHPTRWHARDYGLFGANPFCEHDMDATQPANSGNYTLEAGHALTLKYRVLLHEGDADAAKVAQRYDEYVTTTK